ncbi:MAG TPA: hypothetical protein PLE74_01055 [Candidatus Cloacimonadota bacterium]|nr:hypothetical protein [Candidatus Cloacimonadota bacterium]
MKLISEMGSLEFYTHRIIEIANLVNIERIQKDSTGMSKHLDDIIKMSAITKSWMDKDV